MDAWASLLSTLAWIGLILWILHRYNSQVGLIVNALTKRIESGSPVKFGGVEIGSGTPMTSEAQVEKLEQDAREISEVADQPAPTSQIIDEYLQVEDLALRKLQADFGSNIVRQVSVAGVNFDGMMKWGGALHGIEVKLIKEKSSSIAPILKSVKSITSRLTENGEPTAGLILVVVFENELTRTNWRPRLSEMANKTSYPMVLQLYTMTELKSTFGANG